MEKTEDKLISDELENQKKLLEENLKALKEEIPSETKSEISENDSESPDIDDYYEIKDDEEPELKTEKGQTIEQAENESEAYY